MWDEVCVFVFEWCDYSSMTSPALSNVYSGMHLFLREKERARRMSASQRWKWEENWVRGPASAPDYIWPASPPDQALRHAFQCRDENRSVSVNTESSCAESALIPDGPCCLMLCSLSVSVMQDEWSCTPACSCCCWCWDVSTHHLWTDPPPLWAWPRLGPS